MSYLVPIFIEKYNIYDIFYNDDNCLIIIIPAEEITPFDIKYISSNNTELNFELYKCPLKLTYIYSLKVEYNKFISIIIKNEIIETFVNVYPSFKDEIIMSTIVKNEDKCIKQWIDFHLMIGITRFIIYDNSKNNTLSEILNEYIENKQLLLIRWSYPYRLKISGISGQTTQQNHSIYAFKNSKYIGLFDVDEYVNIQEKNNINNFFEELIIKENIDVNKISSFKLLNKFFYNPNNLPTDGINLLKIFNCNTIQKSGREKNFVLPKNVFTFAVHKVTNGKPMYIVNETKLFFNHYFFLNKSSRGRNKTDLIDDSILLNYKIS